MFMLEQRCVDLELLVLNIIASRATRLGKNTDVYVKRVIWSVLPTRAYMLIVPKLDTSVNTLRDMTTPVIGSKVSYNIGQYSTGVRLLFGQSE